MSPKDPELPNLQRSASNESRKSVCTPGLMKTGQPQSTARVAYLIGVSGSGKGHLSKRMAQTLMGLHLIETDPFRDKTVSKLGLPDVFSKDNWNHRDDHHRVSEVPATLADLLIDSDRNLSRATHIIAEGIILGHAGWRKAFENALNIAGITPCETPVFWLDPPAEKVFEHRRQRARSGQQAETLANVKNHVEWYRERIRTDGCFRHANADVIGKGIAEFMCVGSGVTETALDCG